MSKEYDDFEANEIKQAAFNRGLDQLSKNKKALERGRKFGEAVVELHESMKGWGRLGDINSASRIVGLNNDTSFVLVPDQPINLVGADYFSWRTIRRSIGETTSGPVLLGKICIAEDDGALVLKGVVGKSSYYDSEYETKVPVLKVAEFSPMEHQIAIGKIVVNTDVKVGVRVQ